jgi:hypothetical protein
MAVSQLRKMSASSWASAAGWTASSGVRGYLVGPCPRCGGDDRLNVILRKNGFNCRGGGDDGGDAKGGVVNFVMHADGLPFREAVLQLTGERAPEPAARPQAVTRKVVDAGADDERRRAQALRWWGEAGPIWKTPAERYLTVVRGLTLPADMMSPRVLRFHPSLPFGPGVFHPCLIALHVTIDGEQPCALMRIAITSDGGKVGKMSFAPTAGTAVKLTDNADVAGWLTIGEGLETTLAGMMAGFAPAWCLGSASGVSGFPVLGGIETLRILVDADEAGRRAAQTCGQRWMAAGREVFGIMSGTEGEDFADLATGAAA